MESGKELLTHVDNKHVQKSCGPFEELIEGLCGWNARDTGAECCEVKIEVEIRYHDKDFCLYTKGNGKSLKCFKLGLGVRGS